MLITQGAAFSHSNYQTTVNVSWYLALSDAGAAVFGITENKLFSLTSLFCCVLASFQHELLLKLL